MYRLLINRQRGAFYLGMMALLGLPGLLSPVVHALPLVCTDGPGIDLVATGCLIHRAGPGSVDAESAVEQAIQQATGDAVDIRLYGKSDATHAALLISFDPDGATDLNASLSGLWRVLDGTLISYITVKAARTAALYQIAPPAASGRYTSEGILNGGGRQPTVSHISFWTTLDTPVPPKQTSVPEPGVFAMLGLGLGMLGRVRRKLWVPFSVRNDL